MNYLNKNLHHKYLIQTIENSDIHISKLKFNFRNLFKWYLNTLVRKLLSEGYDLKILVIRYVSQLYAFYHRTHSVIMVKPS